MMKVLTLCENMFADKCSELQKMVTADGYNFDTIVSIAAGGDYVAEAVIRNIAHNGKEIPAHFSVKRRRKGSSLKKGNLKSLISMMPRGICNLLRIAESKFYALAGKFNKYKFNPVEIPAELISLMRTGKSRRILIVDDAVDSGGTLLDVAISLNNAITPDFGIIPEIRTAVIVVTRRNPSIIPDYSIYPEGQFLIRFPWAVDS
ncbi:MAG: hypothetical protein NC204_04250 [Candidatus Amulumruptor caecigallinarius]|nr:hypothetical protein [Candidatus Amulumruptor caecigallinarius]